MISYISRRVVRERAVRATVRAALRRHRNRYPSQPSPPWSSIRDERQMLRDSAQPKQPLGLGRGLDQADACSAAFRAGMLDQDVESGGVDEGDGEEVNHDPRRVRASCSYQRLVEQRGCRDVEFPVDDEHERSIAPDGVDPERDVQARFPGEKQRRLRWPLRSRTRHSRASLGSLGPSRWPACSHADVPDRTSPVTVRSPVERHRPEGRYPRGFRWAR